MANQIPVVGEPYKEYVKKQIDDRQKVYGSGFGPTKTRTPEEMSYLNSNTSWIKMASSVDVTHSFRVKNLDRLTGTNLAKNGVLFNGITKKTENGYSMKSGVSTNNSLINNSAYGFGGTEFGLSPLPGITSFNIKHENRGSIRTAEISLKAFNKFQFNLIETLYLRLGYTILIEWGHSKYINKDSNISTTTDTLIDNYWFETSGKSHLEMLTKIDDKRKSNVGNYDGLFGKIVNFNWKVETDGSYSITIMMASLGDVVESFKLNSMVPTIEVDNAVYSPDGKENINPIDQILKDQQTLIDKDKSYSNNKDQLYLSLEAMEVAFDSTNLLSFSNIEPSLKTFIRLDEFISKINEHLIPHYLKPTGECFPLFSIDQSQESLMAAIPNLISIDPSVCIIKPKWDKEFLKLSKTYSPQFSLKEMGVEKFMNDFFIGDVPNVGIISNIYLNFSYLRKLATTTQDSKGNISFFSYFKSLLDGVNRSFANVCELKITIDEDTNKVIIRDSKLTAKTQPNGKPLEDDTSKEGVINVYGFNSGKSNFVKSYSFTTQITNELKNSLTIGATANSSVVNENATLFSKWNRGLQDRYQLKSANGKKPNCKEKTKDSDGMIVLATTPTSTINPTIDLSPKLEVPSGKPTPRMTQWQKQREGYLFYLVTTFTGRDYLTYFELHPDHIEKGKQKLKTTLTTQYNYQFESSDNTLPSSAIGYIPIELTLELKGISGMKIFNEVRIETEFLPETYGDIMTFVVMGVDHKVDGNEWVTSLRACSKPKTKYISPPPQRNVYVANEGEIIGITSADFVNTTPTPATIEAPTPITPIN